MGNKYHFNRETGRANICRAQHNCPLGEDAPHFDTKDEAKAYIETEAKSNNSSFTILSKESTQDNVKVGEFGAYYNRENYRIPEDNYNKFVKSIERANKKLEKYGIEGRFEFEEVEKFKEFEETGGGKSAKRFYEIKMNAPTFAYNGYEFMAAAVQEDNGIVVRAPNGVELNGWRPDSMKCEHCGQNRTRSKSYLIQTPNGELKQIGSSCVEAYMGVKPEGLSALEYNPSDFEDNEDDYREFNHSRNKYRSTDELLAISLAVSNGGRDYVSTQSDWSESTASMVFRYMQPNRHMDEEELRWREKVTVRLKELYSNGEVDKLKKKLQKIDGDNDYIKNIKILTGGDWVKSENSSLLISSVSVIGREERAERRAKEAKEREEIEKKRINEAPKGHYLKEGEKIPKGSKFTVTEAKEYEAYNPYTHQNERKLSVNMLSEDNKNIQWFTIPPRDENGHKRVYTIGEELSVSSGKVKSHGAYKGVDQTVISNVRLMK